MTVNAEAESQGLPWMHFDHMKKNVCMLKHAYFFTVSGIRKRENNEKNRTIDSAKKINALSVAVLHLMSVCRYF